MAKNEHEDKSNKKNGQGYFHYNFKYFRNNVRKHKNQNNKKQNCCSVIAQKKFKIISGRIV
jgi:hypothetical protein